MPSARTFENSTSTAHSINQQLLLEPKRLSVRRLLFGHFHWKCLLCSLLIALCAFHVGYCQFYGPANQFHSLSHSPGPCSHGYNLIPMALGALLYMIYLSECWHYRSQLCGLPRMGANKIGQLAEAMRKAVPLVWWKSVSYHYLRRTRQISRYRNGDVVSRTQVYYERVNSHQSGNVFLYDQCGYKDISKELAQIGQFPMIRMRFSKGFVFACLQAANEFEEQRSRFFSENEMLDDYMEVREGLDLANLPFIERLLIFPEIGPHRHSRQKGLFKWLFGSAGSSNSSASSLHIPFWLSPWLFWPSSVLLLSWPLRMMAEWRTGHVHLQITKLFGTNYLSPSSANYTGPLTRTSTMDSNELELANRQNYLMVPSYSEAILLDPYQHQHQQHSIATQSACLFRQIFSSPQRNGMVAPSVSHNEPPPLLGTTNAFDYGSFGKNGNMKGIPSSPSAAIVGPPTRSRSIGCFDSNGNESLANGRSIRDGQSNGRRHLPRPSTLAAAQRRGGHQHNQQRRRQPPRSMTISEGIVEHQREDGGRHHPSQCSELMPLLMEREEDNNNNNHPHPPPPPPRHHHPHPHHLTSSNFHHLAIFGQQPPLADEPPPSYEIALRYCSPIYNRLRQSVQSISSMFSRSSSRPDLCEQNESAPNSSLHS